MQVILKSDVDHLGYKNDVVDVKRGYWRNYLRPRNLAETATTERLRELAEAMERRRAVEARDKAEALELKEMIGRTTISISANVGPTGQLFGSVGTSDISRTLEATRKLRLDAKKIKLDSPLKSIGVFPVTIDLGHGVTSDLTVEVVEQLLSEDEAAQLEAAEKAAEEKAAADAVDGVENAAETSGDAQEADAAVEA